MSHLYALDRNKTPHSCSPEISRCRLKKTQLWSCGLGNIYRTTALPLRSSENSTHTSDHTPASLHYGVWCTCSTSPCVVSLLLFFSLSRRYQSFNCTSLPLVRSKYKFVVHQIETFFVYGFILHEITLFKCSVRTQLCARKDFSINFISITVFS